MKKPITITKYILITLMVVGVGFVGNVMFGQVDIKFLPDEPEAIAHYTFENTTLAQVGTVIGSPKFINAKSGKAVRFDGRHDSLEIPDIDTGLFDGRKSFTLSAWVRPNDRYFPAGTAKTNVFLGGDGFHYGLVIDGYGTGYSVLRLCSLYWADDAGNYTAQKTCRDDVLHTIWYHVASTYDHATKITSLYVNGKLVGTHDFSPQGGIVRVNPNSLFSIGGIGSYTSKADIDEVKVWSSVLSPEAVNKEYREKKILIGAYYTPFYVSPKENHFKITAGEFSFFKDCISDTSPEFFFKESIYNNYVKDDETSDNDGMSTNGKVCGTTMAPLYEVHCRNKLVWIEELEHIYGSFELFKNPPSDLSEYPENNIDENDSIEERTPWFRLQNSLEILKEYWKARGRSGPDDFVPENFAVFPRPLSVEAGGLGYYASENVDVVRLQKELANHYGIDFLAMEWYMSIDSRINYDPWGSSYTYESVEFKTAPLPVFFDTPAEGDLKLALLWVVLDHVPAVECQHRQDFSCKTSKILADRLEPFLKNEQYLYIDGKPAVFIFNTHILLDKPAPTDGCTDPFAEVDRILREEKGMPGVNFIPTDSYRDNLYADKLNKSDAVSHVGLTGPEHFTSKNYDDYLEKLVSEWELSESFYDQKKKVLKVFMSINPELVVAEGSAQYRANRKLNDEFGTYSVESPSLDLDKGTSPAKFREVMLKAKDHINKYGVDDTHHLLIWSWNNWHEGTALEPTDLFGYKYLDVIKNLDNSMSPCFDPPPIVEIP